MKSQTDAASFESSTADRFSPFSSILTRCLPAGESMSLLA